MLYILKDPVPSILKRFVPSFLPSKNLVIKTANRSNHNFMEFCHTHFIKAALIFCLFTNVTYFRIQFSYFTFKDVWSYSSEYWNTGNGEKSVRSKVSYQLGNFRVASLLAINQRTSFLSMYNTICAPKLPPETQHRALFILLPLKPTEIQNILLQKKQRRKY